MGRIFRSPMIIEFNGLPGSGKTTILRKLRDLLVNDFGVNVITNYAKNYWHQSAYSLLFSPRYYRTIAIVNHYSNLFSERRSVVRRLTIPSFIRKYHCFIKQVEIDVLLVDQGIIQALLSLAHNEIMIESEFLYAIVKESGIEKLPILIINCDCDVKLSASRIKERPNNGARVHSMGDFELYDTLNVQSYNLNYIRSVISDVCPTINSLTIDTSADIEYNVNCILKLISSHVV